MLILLCKISSEEEREKRIGGGFADIEIKIRIYADKTSPCFQGENFYDKIYF